MASKPTHVAIIGLGTFGLAIARDLVKMGDRVTGIDIDPALVASVREEFDTVAEGDASDIKTLAECSLESFDAVVVSIGENTEASILTAMNVLELGCSRIWVKAQGKTHRKILEAIGVPNVVQPEQAHGERIAQIIHNEQLADYLLLKKGLYVAKVVAPERYCQKVIGSLELEDRYSIRCLGVVRDDELITAKINKQTLEDDDALLLAGKPIDLRRFADS